VDPFLSDNPAIAKRQPRPPQSRATPGAAPTASAVASSPTQVASRPPIVAPKSTSTANAKAALDKTTLAKATDAKPTAKKPTVAQTTLPVRPAQQTIAQVSAKVPADARRPKLAVPPTAAAAYPPVITPAAPESNAVDISTVATGYERQRADRLMERAQKMLSNDFPEEALRLAAVAEQLEKSKQAAYLPGEERPSDFVARLQRTSPEIDSTSSSNLPGTESGTAKASRIRSRPTAPLTSGLKRGRIELTDIRAGWQPATDSDENGIAAIERTTGETATDRAHQTQVALLETSGKRENHPAAAGGAGSGTTTEAPAPPDALPAGGADLAADDIADVEPVTSSDSNAPHAAVNTTTIGGLLAGLAGLLGIAYWRRQERKHYAGAAR
jgi:hypothetical protein